jgi:N-acetylglucosamine-6-phosphate deacetylase
LRGRTGSTLTQDASLRHAVVDARMPPIDAIAALTATRTCALGFNGRLGPLASGFAADAVRLDEDGSVGSVWAAGEEVG